MRTKERISELGIPIAMLSNWLGITRPTFYNYCNQYDSQDYKSITQNFISLFDFINSLNCTKNVDLIEFIWKYHLTLLDDPRDFSLYVEKLLDKQRILTLDVDNNPDAATDFSRLAIVHMELMNHIYGDSGIPQSRLQKYLITPESQSNTKFLFNSKYTNLRYILELISNLLNSEDVEACGLRSIDYINNLIKETMDDINSLDSISPGDTIGLSTQINEINNKFNQILLSNSKKWFAVMSVVNLDVEQLETNFGIYHSFGECDIKNELKSQYGLLEDFRDSGLIAALILGPYDTEKDALKISNFLEVNYDLNSGDLYSVDNLKEWMRSMKNQLQEDKLYYI